VRRCWFTARRSGIICSARREAEQTCNMWRILNWSSSTRRQSAAVACVVLSSAFALDAQQDAAEVYKRSRDSVVLIEGQHHIGSAIGCGPIRTN
jgi:hypothetical protein